MDQARSVDAQGNDAPLHHDSYLDRERRAHEVFAASRRRSYVPRPSVIEQLDYHAIADTPPLVILGESGSGKSALISYWTAEYRRSHPDEFVITYHVGASSSMDTRIDFIRRVALEIADRLGSTEETPLNGDELEEAFPFMLAEAASAGLLLVIDGVNQLDEKARDLEWLPEFIPAGIGLIITSVEPPTRAVRGGWQELRLEPLSENERIAISNHYLGDRRMKLDPERLARITADTPSSNPLFLRTRLEEIRLFGSYEHLNRRIDRYLNAQTLDELFDRVLERLEEEHGETIVRDVLSAICGSRYGLTEEDLAKIVGCDRDKLAVLIAGLENYLLCGDGRYRFFHDAVRIGVERRYLGDKERNLTHRKLAHYFEELPVDSRIATELPWQWQRAGDNDRLARVIGRIEIVEQVVLDQREYELFGYWLALGRGGEMAAIYHEAIENHIAGGGDRRRLPILLGHIGEFLRLCGRFDEALPFQERAVALSRELLGEEHEETATGFYNLANILQSLGDFQEAETYYRHALTIQERLLGNEHQSTAKTMGCLATVVRSRGDLDGAEGLYRMVLRLLERPGLRDDGHLVIYMNNLAGVLHDKGKYDEAEALYGRALEMWENLFGPEHPNVAVALNNIATLRFDMGRGDTAAPMCERALGIWEHALGSNHPMVASVLNNWAGMIAVENPAQAISLMERALAIHEKVYHGPHPDTAILIYSCGRVQHRGGNLALAEEYFQRAYEMQCALFGHDHVDTAITLGGLGAVYRDRGDYETGSRMMLDAISIMERHLGVDHLFIALQMKALVSSLLQAGEYERASHYARRAIAIFETAGPDHQVKAVELRGMLERAESMMPDSGSVE